MNTYLATANSDWGVVYANEQIRASSFKVAFGRAGHLAQHRCRRRPKMLGITLRFIGREAPSNRRLAAALQAASEIADIELINAAGYTSRNGEN